MPAAAASPETGLPSKVVLFFVQGLGFIVQGPEFRVPYIPLGLTKGKSGLYKGYIGVI